MSIGTKLNNLLKERKTNVPQLAERINVPKTTLYSIINRNNKKVGIDILIAVANVLDVPVEYFGDNYEPALNGGAFLNHDEKQLLENFRKLNSAGKKATLEFIDNATYNPKYTAPAEKEKIS